MSEQTNKFFVYGTLRSGSVRENVMSGCERLDGEFRVKGTLYSTGSYPTLVLEGEDDVVGEVYVPNEEDAARLERTLDAIEGIAYGLFDKEIVEVSNGETTHKCKVYTAGPRIRRRLESLPVIPNGDWMNYGQ